jgi:protein ImuB
LFAVIYIPEFLLQAALRPTPELHSKPVALVDGAAAKSVVLQLTPAALEHGVAEGMSPAQALARCSEIILKTRSPAQERTAARALLDCASGFSPYIEATADGVCTLDLKGNPLLATLLEREGELWPVTAKPESDPLLIWAGKMLARLLELNLAAQIGIARTPLLALHAARVASPIRIVERADEFLADLPIESIEPSAQTFAILKKWGIHTLGAFTALGKDRLAERLGPEALTLFERATAESIRPLRLVNPPDTFEEAIDFDHEIETAQPLLFGLRRFLEQIALRLEAVYLVATEIQLRLIFSHGPDHARAFKVPSATRNVATLFRILDTHLETLRTEHPIIGLRLSVAPIKPSHQQFSLFESALRDPNQFYETLARLTGLVGSERVGVPNVTDTHRPDAFHLQPVNFELIAAAQSREEVPSPKVLAHCQQAPKKLQVPNRACEKSFGLPLRRLRPPLSARVELRDNCPAALKTENFARAIVAAHGPWRSSGDWWDQQSWAREEWDIETAQGELYRLCHREGQWFVEAMYD